MHDQVAHIEGWCHGRNGYWRSLLWCFFAYILFRHLTNMEYGGILKPLNLGIHECGHMIFGWAGQFGAILGGTLTEIAAPLAGMWNFYVQEDYFSITLCFGWLSTALFDVATYVADARAMELPLVAPFGGGDEVNHDWNYLLGQLGLLPWDTALAMLMRGMAFFSMLICLGIGGWMIVVMITNSGKYKSLD